MCSTPSLAVEPVQNGPVHVVDVLCSWLITHLFVSFCWCLRRRKQMHWILESHTVCSHYFKVRSECPVPGSAVVQVRSFGSWNCVGFICMAAAIRRSNGLLRVVVIFEISGSEPWASSSTSRRSSSMSFCSDGVGVSVEEVLELGVAGRLLGRLSKSRTWATAARSPVPPDPTEGSRRNVPHSCSGAGEGVCFPSCSSNRPLICSFFCSLFC